MTKNLFIEVLNRYRNGNMTLDELHSWLISNSSVASSNLKRSSYLKLKQGNPLPACKETLHPCKYCDYTFPQGDFEDYATFGKCDDEIKKNRSINNIVAIQEPSFANLLPKALGGSVFFKCSHCCSVWQIILPERAQRGSWNRVA